MVLQHLMLLIDYLLIEQILHFSQCMPRLL
jgi:hypothetical protein